MTAPERPEDALLRLAEAERDLAAAGRIEELAAVQDERDRVLAARPAAPSPAAAATLRRAIGVQREAAELLRAARDAVGAELARIDQGRATLRGYTPAGTEPARTFDASG